MKTLSIEHRNLLSRIQTEKHEAKRKRIGAYGNAYRREVILELKKIVCDQCDDDTKSRCTSLTNEKARNGRLITCMRKKISIKDDHERT
jgi:hypothetical protein